MTLPASSLERMKPDPKEASADHQPEANASPEHRFFARVPQAVLDASVSHGAVHLYAVLDRFAGRKCKCWPSRRTLSKLVRGSVDSVDRYLRELAEAGLIAVEPQTRKGGAGQTSNLYTLKATQELDEVASSSASSRSKSSAQLGMDAPRPPQDRGDLSAPVPRHPGAPVPLEGELTEQDPEGTTTSGTSLKPGEEGTGGDTDPPPAREEVRDAIARVCRMPSDRLTKSAKKILEQATTELCDVNATVDQIEWAGENWPFSYPLTAASLARHWGPMSSTPGWKRPWRTEDSKDEYKPLPDADDFIRAFGSIE